jgi:LPXTG-motif cell wall-anchored protein
MSLFDPQTAEEKMAWVPIIGCLFPLLVVGAVLVLVFV